METQWETTHLPVRGRWGQSQHSRADGAENQTSHQQQMACGQLECGKCGSPFPGGSSYQHGEAQGTWRPLPSYFHI